jgi:hypothetical protein
MSGLKGKREDYLEELPSFYQDRVGRDPDKRDRIPDYTLKKEDHAR